MATKAAGWPRFVLRTLQEEIDLLNYDLFGSDKHTRQFKYSTSASIYLRQSLQHLVFVGQPNRHGIIFITCSNQIPSLDYEHAWSTDIIVNQRVYEMENRFPDLTFEIEQHD